MVRAESNLFPILNIETLSARYKPYRIRGLDPEDQDYFLHRAQVERELRYMLRVPVIITEHDGELCLVVPDEAPDPSPSLIVVRRQVAFERAGNNLELDFRQRSPDNDAICIRFLQFAIQGALHNCSDLWQPASGRPFYEKAGDLVRNIVNYRGFSVRTIVTPDGGISLCVDIATCYTGASSLPSVMNREHFTQTYKGKLLIYHYGHTWYEIRADGLSDFTVDEHVIQKNGQFIPLLTYIRDNTRRPLPLELERLDPKAATILYRDNTGQEKAVPAPLCYPVYGTLHPEVARHHNRSQLSPDIRRRHILNYVRKYLTSIKFGLRTLSVDTRPLVIPGNSFRVPDLRFGNKVVLSAKGTSGVRRVELGEFGKARLALLRDRSIGFYEKEELYRQYLIMPRSVGETYGPHLVRDIKHAVNDLYPGGKYDPILVFYDDRVPRRFISQARAFLEGVGGNIAKGGYGLVIIHPLKDRAVREEDPLAAFVISELRKRDVRAAVIHTEVLERSYERINAGTITVSYGTKVEERGRFNGYLRNVALNKVLLANRLLPFILEERMHADLAIGIDVKNHTAGLSLVDRFGGKFFTIFEESNQRERLLKDQMKQYLEQAIKEMLSHIHYVPQVIVLYRDGRVYGSEVKGARQAIQALVQEGRLNGEATLNIIEISKSSPAPLRIFDISQMAGEDVCVNNPSIGTYYCTDPDNGYICTTGLPLLTGIRGTARPLHVRKIEGSLTLIDCMKDVFFLSSLTWTRPEGYMRTPIIIKLLDRFLYEEAAEFDEDQIRFAESEID